MNHNNFKCNNITSIFFKGSEKMRYVYTVKKRNLGNGDIGEKDFENGKIGKKAENLLELRKNGFNVPEFFVVTSGYFEENIFSEICSGKGYEFSDWDSIFFENGNDVSERKKNEKIEFIKEIIKTHKINEDFKKEIFSMVKDEEYYAVRSSSIEEDSDNFSFAGQFETFLYVTKEELFEKIREVWLSSFSSHIMKYRFEKKINNKINVPAVIVQKMVNSDTAGVAFSVNPINSNIDEITISATFGLGSSIVDGDENGDLYIFNKRNGEIKKEIKIKKVKHSPDFQNKKMIVEKIDRKDVVLNDSEIKRLAREIENIEKFYGKAQDIEWAFENGELFILQARPITTLESPRITANTIIWDNSNIIESYPEITLPLTFSFIKSAYAGVYRQFSEVVGVSPKIIESYQTVYENMIGILNGRVYYNLLNWYKLLLLFPNAKENSKFMEQMMGVKKELSQEMLNENLFSVTKNMNLFEKIFMKIKKIQAGMSIFLNMFLIEKKVEKFYKLIDKNINDENYDVEKMAIVELKKYYKWLENTFLKRWDVPIINDFLVMVWFGISKKILKKYVKDNFSNIHNILINQEGRQMVSVEPSEYLKKMSSLIRENADLKEEIKNIVFENKKVEKANKKNMYKITKNEKFNELFSEYLRKFGDRTVHELKLESPTLKENPLFLLKMIFSMSNISKVEKAEKRNVEAEQKEIYKNMKINFVKKMLLKKSVFYARKFVKMRENLRYERTKVYAITRKIMKKIGFYLENAKIIENERDVFYLKIDEIFGLIDGGIIDVDVKKLVKMRKEQYENFEKMEALPDRFLTQGFLSENFYYENLTNKETFENGNLKGIGCSKGNVSGKIKIVLNPMETEVEKGDIVVTKSTDPSWVMVFPLIKGLIVEKGSLLSHSAIISREMNIPAVVGVENVTKILKNGDFVEFDGSTGIIKILDKNKNEKSEEMNEQ